MTTIRQVPELVIGLGHRARSGKDTIADHLVAKHGFTKYAMADLLKQSVNLVMGWDDRHSYGDLKEKVDPFWGVTPRLMYQRIGTEGWRTLFREDVWAAAIQKKILADAAAAPPEKPLRAVITDVRFKVGEVGMVRSLQGALWKVDRPSLPPLVVPPRTTFGKVVDYFNSGFGGPVPTYSHPSEYDMHDFDHWDEVIVNDSTLEVLYAKADAAVAKTIRGKDTRTW